jgi:hypothetical protein
MKSYRPECDRLTVGRIEQLNDTPATPDLSQARLTLSAHALLIRPGSPHAAERAEALRTLLAEASGSAGPRYSAETVDALREEAQALREQLAERTAEVERLQAQVVELPALSEALAGEQAMARALDGCMRERDGARAEVERLQREVTHLHGSLHEAAEVLRAVRADIAAQGRVVAVGYVLVDEDWGPRIDALLARLEPQEKTR